MPKRTSRAIKDSKHEHWVKKSAIVAVIAAVITFLGGLNLLIYSYGHLTPLRASLVSAPFWIAVVTLIVVAVLVDYIKSNLKKVYWVENICGGVLGAIGYFAFFGVLGILAFTTIAGFILGALVLFILFYGGFVVGHTLDMVLRKAGVDIN